MSVSGIRVLNPGNLGVKQKYVHCHELVYETAKGMASAVYEGLMRNNDIYAHWKQSFENEYEQFKSGASEERFVELLAPKLIEDARHTLAKMLNGGVDSKQKALIHDALVKDWQLRRGRMPQKRKLFRL